MSLINDALKQASRSQKVALAGAGGGGAAGGLRATEESEAPRKSVSTYILPILLVFVLAGSGWFTWQWWQHRRAGTEFNVGTQLAGMMNSVKSLGGKKSASDDGAQAATSSDASTGSTTEPKSGNMITRLFQKGSSTPDSPAGFPKLKLQGVYYRTGDSTALINGKNVMEGDEIEGVSVARIDKQSVELQFQGETRVLRIH